MVTAYTLNPRARRGYQSRSLLNLLRMGHCAPTVMRTLLQLTRSEQEWLVKLTAGLPGGIGNTQGECGGLTSPLILLGLRHSLDEMRGGLPVLFDYGDAYCQRFQGKNAALLCKEIQGKGCVQAVCHAPGLLAETVVADNGVTIPKERRTAYARLYAHFLAQDFHCAEAVFQALSPVVPVPQELHRAASAFIGGTLFQGLTCSAFAAGVMSLGLQTGEIENSYLRVIRMLAQGMDISDERANKFHRTINAGQRLSEWFTAEFGSTQCQAITRSNFSTTDGVARYIANESVTSCKQIADRVAEQVQKVLSEKINSEVIQ